jgi:DNA-binding NarL/FixJ family response regulator
MSKKLIIVDDHAIMRDGIKAILRNSPEFTIAGEADNGADCLRLCEASKPDLVVMDIGLPDRDGIEITVELRRRYPATKVLILSMYDDEQSIFRAVQAGARGYVLKKASDSGDLRHALQTVASGGFYLSPCAADKLYGRIRAGGAEDQAESSFLERLSARERQVFRLIAEGKTSKEAAVVLQLGVQTVRSYRKTLMSKLEVHNVANLTQLALACGLVHHPGPVSETQKEPDRLPKSPKLGPIRWESPPK